MARTPAFAAAMRLLARSRRSLGVQVPAHSALSRRRALLLIAAAATAACVPRPGTRTASPAAPPGPVAIVGGGTAGLTVAYRLAQAGQASTLYESSNRFGGRMFTYRGMNGGSQICELGGELVDTGHTALRSLCEELGVGIDRLSPEDAPTVDVFHFGGKLRTPVDLLDPERSGGALRPLLLRIAADQDALLDANEDWTDRARALDAMSLADYLTAGPEVTPDWALDLLRVSYEGEYGLALEDQSALNLIDFISADTGAEFAMFGESDEAFRIRGGSSALPDALLALLRSAALSTHASLAPGRTLTAIAAGEAGLTLTFQAGDRTETVSAATVVLALPFTRLRSVEGIGALGLSPAKLDAIRTLGYGENSKVMVPATGRPWLGGAFKGLNRPVSSIVADAGFQTVWDTTRGQDGPDGILTNFLSGAPARGDQVAALAALSGGLATVSPDIAAALRPTEAVSFFWPAHPQTLGSYASARVGQYTSMLEVTGLAERGGALIFAGEHTSADYLGFMNGAVESGERAAGEVLSPA